MKLFILSILIVLNTQDAIIGKWISHDKDLIIDCYKKGDVYYSKIVWFKDTSPKTKKYSENGIEKDKWIGYVVMEDFHFKEDHWEGYINDIKHGKKYLATIYKEKNNLELKVYYFFIPVKTIIFDKYK